MLLRVCFVYTTGEGNVLLRDCLRVPPVRATCCVTVFRVPPVKATSCCMFSLHFPLMRIACYCVTVFAGTTGEGNISLCDCFSFSTSEGNMLLRDSLCMPPVKATCCCMAASRIPLVKATSCTCVHSW